MRCTGSQAKESSYRPDQHVRSSATCSNGGVRGRTAVETTSLFRSFPVRGTPTRAALRRGSSAAYSCRPGLQRVTSGSWQSREMS